MKKIFVLCLIYSFVTIAKPPEQPYNKPWPERNSALYNFKLIPFVSNDNKRQYDVWLATPKVSSEKPAQVLYLLDGQVALQLVEDADFDSKKELPVLVFIGYKNSRMFHKEARTYDYTPPLAPDSYTGDDPDNERPAGGSKVFLALINQQIKPSIEKLTSIDQARQTLWGHSYGGLFVLYTLFNEHQSFQHYIAADPSLWWHKGFILSQANQLQYSSNTTATSILVIKGKKNRKIIMANKKTDTPKAKAMSFIAPNAIENLIKQLSTITWLSADYQSVPLSHGEIFKDSLQKTLRASQK